MVLVKRRQKISGRIHKISIQDFRNESHATLFSEKDESHAPLYCAADNECTNFSSDCAFVFTKDLEQLAGDHEEADTRIAFHAMHLKERYYVARFSFCSYFVC